MKQKRLRNDMTDPYEPRQCPNIKRSPDGIDGERLSCGICGYDHRLDGRYFKWVTYPPPLPKGAPCAIGTIAVD
jgi:hypothetical protein